MEPRHLNHKLAGYALLAATALRTVSIFLWPPNSDASHAKMLATATAHPALWNAATLVEPAAWLLAVPAVFSCITLVAGRGRLLTTIGGWLWAVSMLALGFVGIALNGVTAVLAGEPHRALMVQIIDDIKHAPVLLPPVLLVLLGMPALLVFTAGLTRAGLFRWWLPALAATAVLAYLATEEVSSHLVVLAGFLPLAAVWAAQARMLIGVSAAPELEISRAAVAPA